MNRTSTNYRQSIPSFRCTYTVFHITNLKWGCWASECLGWQSWNFAVQSPDPDPSSLGAFKLHINKMICKIVKKCLTIWSIRKSTTDLTSNIAGCKLVPAGHQRQLYLAATPAQIQWLQAYLKQNIEFVPENLGIIIKSVTLPRLLFHSYHQETSNEHAKDNKLTWLNSLGNCFTTHDLCLKYEAC